jgi:hypothetical protein
MGSGKSPEREIKAENVLSLFSQVRSRLNTVAWALHGMHCDEEAPNPEDIAAVEQLVAETVEGPFAEAVQMVATVLGAEDGESVTKH